MSTVLALATPLGVRSEFPVQGETVQRGGLAGQGDGRGSGGGITEVAGPESSGRTTLLHALLASATGKLEVCAYVDTDNAFDRCSAAANGVVLSQLIWVRCDHHAEHAFKAADLLLHAGGFGVVVLDLSRTSDSMLRRVPISYWYRFRRAIENTPTILALLEREAQAKSCATLILELKRKQALWAGAPGFHLLREVEIEAGCRKPFRPAAANFQARVW